MFGEGLLKPSFYKPLILFPLLVFAFASADALDPSLHIAQYGHTRWMMQDGILPGTPTAFAQTTDGYLWIGTRAGLLRFDGVRYARLEDQNKNLPSESIWALAATRDGSLWIGTDHGLSRWTNHNLVGYPDVTGWVFDILEDRDGKVWLTVLDRDSHANSFCQVVGSGAKCYARPQRVVMNDAYAIAADEEGALWLGDTTSVFRWESGSFTDYPLPGLSSKNRVYHVDAVAPTQSGPLWVGISVAGRGLGLQQLNQGRWRPFVTPTLDGSTLPIQVLFFDRQGALWVGSSGHGLYRIYNQQVEQFLSVDGLSSDSIQKIYEDHEGNLWVATSRGIDCFRQIHVITFRGPEGRGEDEADGVLASRDGTVWVARAGSLDAIRDVKLSSIKTGSGLPGQNVTSLLEDYRGRLWVGIDDTLSIYQNGTFHPIKRADGRSLGFVVGLAEDVEHNVWAEIIGPPRTLFRIRDLYVKDVFLAPEMPAARKVAADPQGGIWLGLLDGDLARYRMGKLQVFHYERQNARTDIKQLIVTDGGAVFGATDGGLIAWKEGTQRELTIRNGLPCNNVFSQLLDKSETLWLNTQCGLLEIGDSELQKWWKNPDAILQFKLLGAFDGVQPGDPPFNGATRTPDGRLWFANRMSLQMRDPTRADMNLIVPPVQIEEIVADRKSYSAYQSVRLPALTRDIEIAYTALSFVVPEKVRFRYMLEGYDKGWQEPGTRRQAFYTDLAPKKYRFRVIACNNDGLWNEEGANLEFSVQPAWYQTNWFLMICVVITLFVVWSVYRLRLRQAERMISARFDERLAERTRIAREIHDTLVQTIQGSRMVADNALNEATDFPRMRQAMERLSVWLGQATQEGREALNSLRTSTTETNDLAESFRRALDDCRLQGLRDVNFVADGKKTEMHPIVRDEIYRIGYEAIRNACQHSGGTRLEVYLSYSRDLTLRITDNGKGIVPAVVGQGKDGHYGLQGMRERAVRISGKLTLTTSADSGTNIELIVPGRIVFRRPRSGWSTRMKDVFRETDGPNNMS